VNTRRRLLAEVLITSGTSDRYVIDMLVTAVTFTG